MSLSPKQHDLSNENTSIDDYQDKSRHSGLAAQTAQAELFELPLEVSQTFTWQPEDLIKDEVTLLLWHSIFGHASLRVIWKLINQKALFGFPEKMTPGQLHFPVCAIHKSNERYSLLRSNWSVKPGGTQFWPNGPFPSRNLPMD
jgi:hypothetical protein